MKRQSLILPEHQLSRVNENPCFPSDGSFYSSLANNRIMRARSAAADLEKAIGHRNRGAGPALNLFGVRYLC